MNASTNGNEVSIDGAGAPPTMPRRRLAIATLIVISIAILIGILCWRSAANRNDAKSPLEECVGVETNTIVPSNAKLDEEVKRPQEQLERYQTSHAVKMHAREQNARHCPSLGDTKTNVLSGGVVMELVWCPPGTFTMGSPADEIGRDNDEVQHRVTLTKGFWIGKYEVTQAQWKCVTGMSIVDQTRAMLEDDTLYNLDGKLRTLRDFYHLSRGADPVEQCGEECDLLPIYQVNWYEANAFCEKLTRLECGAGKISNDYEFRLPTEAEWEYACHAGTDMFVLDAIAWYNRNASVDFSGHGWIVSNCNDTHGSGGYAGPRLVGSKAANGWGIHDMIGNVWEWCADWYGEYGGDATDPMGVATGSARVARGGSWSRDARYCRYAYRGRNSPGIRNRSLGFRVVLAPR